MIADHIYGKYDVFKRFKPLALGIDQDLIAALPQFDAALIARVLANHCLRPRYLNALARGVIRFDLIHRFNGEVIFEEQAIAQIDPFVQLALQQQSADAAAETGGLLKPKLPVLPQQNKSPNEMPSENRFGFRRHFCVCGNYVSNIEFRRIAFALHPGLAGGGFAFAHQFDEDVACVRHPRLACFVPATGGGCHGALVVSLSWSGCRHLPLSNRLN